MTHECDYCGRHPSACGELRMMPDAERGGAYFPTCHTCHDAQSECAGEACAWLALPTTDEWDRDIDCLRDAMWRDFNSALQIREARL